MKSFSERSAISAAKEYVVILFDILAEKRNV